MRKFINFLLKFTVLNSRYKLINNKKKLYKNNSNKVEIYKYQIPEFVS